MKLPNKIISYNESNISKFVPIIEVLIENDENVFSLYKKTIKYFKGIEEYIDTLDCLFALKKIILSESEEIHYVAWDILRTISSKKSNL